MESRKLKKDEIEVHTEFQGKTHTFHCKKSEIIKKISKYYNIPVSDVQIQEKLAEEDKMHWEIMSLDKVQNSVKLKVLDKRNTKYNDVCTDSESLTYNNQDIIKRLRQNTVLTDGQRTRLVRMLENENEQPLDAVLPEFPNSRKEDFEQQVNFTKPTSHKQCQTKGRPPDSGSSTDVGDPGENIKRMKIMHKSQASDNAVFDMMNRTFDVRRNYILKDSPLVLVIKEKYPLLFSATEVKHEFERILYQGKCSEVIYNMKQFSKAILKIMHAKNSTGLYDTVEKIKKECQSTMQIEYVETVGALLLLPTYFDEMKMFIYFKDEPRPSDFSPYIEAKTYKTEDVLKNRAKFTIRAEKTKICVVNDFLEAMLCLMACHFIFNIQYPDDSFFSMMTFEKLLIETHDSENIPEKVTQFMKMVKGV